MSLELKRAVHPGAVLAYADPELALATLGPRWLPPRAHLRAARRGSGRVLEYGCGCGRVTLALARAGLEVTAVDLSHAMLAHLSAALAHEPSDVQARVRLCHGDLRDVELHERFSVVLMPDGTFQHLYDADDVRAALIRVRGHLAPGGRLRLDVGVPDPRWLAAPPRGAVYQPLTQILIQTLNGDPGTLLAERQYFPAELRGLLERSGARKLRLRLVSPDPIPAGRSSSPFGTRLTAECGWDDDVTAGGSPPPRGCAPR